MKFTKMNGLGNDYIYINCFEETVENPNSLSVEMSNRNFGVGSDGLVLIMPSEIADFRMRMFNSDGSEAEMCGNAIRCVGKYVYDYKLTDKTTISVETLAGIKVLDMALENNKVTTVKVDMGEPILEASLIPVISEKMPVIDEIIEVDGKEYKFTCVSMGNPHAITYVDEVKDFPVDKIGKVVEVDPKFPRKINVEFVEVVDDNTLNMRVWERGAGETMACGTGACATLVASVLNNKVNRKAIVKLLGGDLLIEWNENDNHIYMTGPATVSFQGIWER
ncbi:diaminopimelate epimerase [Natranaerovirga pectinivora]|uniref:Diaminopimelate epimerase n=1 Tax=Natranaerovirga pectinivora TaxID=682400 RepID=A0A4V2V098_9FIRM|nr:diaminopimelate epimerase [Natranaerovirga pectinivora]TCT14713.1 diaminopimelate epimerase [Natranaerovirga pectinivora]